MAMMNCSMGSDFCISGGAAPSANATGTTYTVGGNTSSATSTFYNYPNVTGWDYWQNYYYPTIIRESYPIYIQEKAIDKGKQAFEILKILQDKKLLKVDKVSDFIEAMDSLIKVL